MSFPAPSLKIAFHNTNQTLVLDFAIGLDLGADQYTSDHFVRKLAAVTCYVLRLLGNLPYKTNSTVKQSGSTKRRFHGRLVGLEVQGKKT